MQGSRRAQRPPISPQATLPLGMFKMAGATVMTSARWREADSCSVFKPTELIESTARQCWLKETQVFCCHPCCSFLNGLLETIFNYTERLQVQCKKLSSSSTISEYVADMRPITHEYFSLYILQTRTCSYMTINSHRRQEVT